MGNDLFGSLLIQHSRGCNKFMSKGVSLVIEKSNKEKIVEFQEIITFHENNNNYN